MFGEVIMEGQASLARDLMELEARASLARDRTHRMMIGAQLKSIHGPQILAMTGLRIPAMTGLAQMRAILGALIWTMMLDPREDQASLARVVLMDGEAQVDLASLERVVPMDGEAQASLVRVDPMDGEALASLEKVDLGNQAKAQVVETLGVILGPVHLEKYLRHDLK